MKSYTVTVTQRANSDLIFNLEWWAENRSAEEANIWYEGISAAIFSLSFMPYRCSKYYGVEFGIDVRILRFGVGSRPTHRIYFNIDGNEVIVFRVRSMRESELLDASDPD